jgi:hypothetical protein
VVVGSSSGESGSMLMAGMSYAFLAARRRCHGPAPTWAAAGLPVVDHAGGAGIVI